MSGLALLLNLDGRPATAADLAPMLAEMARRGPDGEGRAVDGTAALGLRLLATTPEALVEPMPFHDPASGCRITGEIRLDNRDELITDFGLRNCGRTVGDGELILRAWDRWGEDCAAHLLGDFAFALWDPRRRQVFAARDQLGMRQLIYAHRPGRVFACASSARAVAVAPDIKPRLNELRLAEALIGFEWGSLTSTFYEGVFRLPPGHCLTVNAGTLNIREYWQMTPPEPLRLKTDSDYAEAFREVLAEAVRCRLRGADNVGSMLSGGMDSGSVVALASRMVDKPLRTFSSVGPDPETCVETRAIHAALTMENLAPTLIDHSHLEPWRDDLVAAWLALEEPFDLHMTQPRTAYLAAKRAGVKVMLDGVAGDVVLDSGSQMARQLRSGHVLRAWREARRLRHFWGAGSDGPALQILRSAYGAFAPDWLRALRRAWRRPAGLQKDAGVDPSFAVRTGLIDVLDACYRAERPKRMSLAAERVQTWPRSGIVVGRERYDRVAAHFGVEPRDPFMDRRVVAFGLSLPMDQLQAGGWPKIVLRRAMAGLLPDAVRWRRGKEHLGWTFSMTLLKGWPEWRTPLEAAREGLAGRAHRDLLQPALWESTPDDTKPYGLHKIYDAALFLKFLKTLEH